MGWLTTAASLLRFPRHLHVRPSRCTNLSEPPCALLLDLDKASSDFTIARAHDAPIFAVAHPSVGERHGHRGASVPVYTFAASPPRDEKA
jgi:hypothetical protein